MKNNEYALRYALVRERFRARNNLVLGFFLGLAVWLVEVMA